MIKKIRTIDYSAWLSLCVIVVLGILSQQNHFLFTQYPIGNIVFFAAAIILASVCAGAIRQIFPRIADWCFAIILALYLYKTWPHMFFDDAGFIMRYLDQLKDGYWFQYNGGEGAVFGISGFLHGLYCSLLVKFTGMAPERALHISNITGLVVSTYFIANIFRFFVQRSGIAYIATFIIICFSKSWADVLFTGMETPLHVAFVMGAFYFLLYNKFRSFYFFAALSIVSKLDAVPVMAVLFIFHGIERIRKFGLKGTFTIEIKPQIIYFWVPLILWVVFSTWLFGSPFPQSAKAKVLYHSGVSDSIFPFLEFGFINNTYKYPMLFIFLGIFIIHLLYISKKGVYSISYAFGFGWMFVAVMAMYYFYNPNEKMLWYYALPEMLFTAQCILSSVWIASQSKDWKQFFLPIVILFAWILYLKPDIDGGRNWMFNYLEKVERERYEIGKYIAKDASPQDKLLAWHGLLAAPFPGYVLDGTGLNSKRAVELKLDKDRMLADLQPTYVIHHGFDLHSEIFSRNGYRISNIFGDVTLENWPAWTLWVKSGKMPMAAITVTDSMLLQGRVMHESNPLKVEGRSVIFSLPPNYKMGNFWCVFEGRGNKEKKIHVKWWGGSEVIDEWDIQLPPYAKEGYPSIYTYGYGLSLNKIRDFGDNYKLNTDSVYKRLEFLPTGEDTVVKINNPIIEYPR